MFPPKKKLFIAVVLCFIPFGVMAVSDTLSVNVDNAQCKDTLDNDGDTLIDFPADPDCTSLNDNSEAVLSQCSDTLDNDGDTLIDFPADPGCSDANDNDETNGGGGGGGDTTPPSITLISPADNAVNVSTTTNLIIDFSEPVLVQTGNIRIKKTSDASTVQTISVNSGQVVLSPNSRLTVTFSTPLLESTSYYVELESGIVSDAAGNVFPGLSGATSWNFSTVNDTISPLISNLTAIPGITSADLSWTTNESAISSFFWGTTTSYASGSGAEIFYSLNHTATLSGLIPDTFYYYRIEARDAFGNNSTASSSFRTLPATDTAPPANPSLFTAAAMSNSIALSWTNPIDPDFAAVKIMRSTTGYPASPSEGVLVYQGNAEATFDASVSVDVVYYYTIFARDTSLNYSSGSVSSAIINSIPIPIPIPIIVPPPPIPPSGGNAGTSTASPTTTPPIIILPPPKVGTTTPSVVIPHFFLTFADFDFFEQELSPRTETKIVPKENEVAVGEKNELKISLSLEKAPPGAKLFIASVKDPVTGKTSSYLLNKTKPGGSYEAVVSPAQKGEYPVNIKIYNAYNELESDVSGFIRVFPPPAPFLSFLPVNLAENIGSSVEAIAPIAVPVGVAVGVSQAVVLAANIGSFYDLYLLFLKFMGLLAGLFRKKKPEPWGVVYDAITKQPIDPAYVVVERMEQGEKKSAITDLDGRYGFLLSPGKYSLVANKTHYKFPSEKLLGKTHDELYDNLYFGSPFELLENQIVRYNVPLDPVEFDWNEFAKNKGKIFSLYSRRQKLRAWVFNALFYTGLIIAAYGIILHPTRLNGLLLSIYGIVIIFQTLWKRKHKVTNLISKITRQPIPFAIVSVTVPGVGVLMKKVVTDQLGRFYLLVPPGIYDIAVQEKQIDGSYAPVYKRINANLKKGVLDGDIIVDE
jgi:hypothetical protein